jgi:hypothetical protein
MFRARRRTGVRWLTGLLSYVAACSVGALAYVGAAVYVFEWRAMVQRRARGDRGGAVWSADQTRPFSEPWACQTGWIGGPSWPLRGVKAP